MREGFINAKPLRRVDLEQARDEINRRLRDVVPTLGWEVVVPLPDLHIGSPVVLCIKWGPAIQKDVRNDPQGPEVASLVVALFHDLQCHVIDRPASARHRLVIFEDRREAEIYQLDSWRVLRIVLKAEVVKLEVAMAHPIAVAIGHCDCNLPHEACCVALCVPPSPCQVVVQVWTPHPLHHESQATALLEDLQQAANARMVHHQLILHLSHHASKLFRSQVL
mmetsp:Transcript_56312/g.163329  ORF Transcript_56312/g.163329 Transcript_56312/m.163329 type:complete len:222 (-) Transcript_56312:725-1390(-)